MKCNSQYLGVIPVPSVGIQIMGAPGRRSRGFLFPARLAASFVVPNYSRDVRYWRLADNRTAQARGFVGAGRV